MKNILLFCISFFCTKNFAQTLTLNRLDSIAEYTQALRAVKTNQLAKAVLLFQKAAEIYHNRRQVANEIQSLIESAVVLYKQKRGAEAVTRLTAQIARIKPDMKMSNIEVYALYKLCFIYNQQDQIAAALQTAQTAYKILPQIDEAERQKYLSMFKNLEGLLAEKQNNIPLAIKYYNESIDINKLSENKEQLLQMGYTYNNIGGLYEKREEWQNAQIFYQKAYQTGFKYAPETLLATMALYNMAYPMEEQGKYQDAIATYQKVLLRYNNTKKVTKEAENKDEADVYTAISGCYVRLQSMEQARIYALRSLAISQHLAADDAAETDFINIVTTNKLLAEVEIYNNQPQKAVVYLLNAEKAAKKAADDYLLEGVLHLKAALYAENSTLGDAEAAFASATAIAKKIDMPIKVAHLQLDLAFARYKKGRKDYADLLKKAKPIFTKYQIKTNLAIVAALEYALVPSAEKPKYEQIRLNALQNCLLPTAIILKITDPILSSKVVQAEPYLRVLEILAAASIGHEKLHFQEKAMQFLLFMRKSIQSDASKLNISVLMRSLVDDALQEVSQQKDAATAFRFIEYAKSLSVLEAQQRNKNQQRANLPQTIIDKENQFKAQLFVLHKQLNKDEIVDGTALNNDAIYTKIIEINNEFEALERSIPQNKNNNEANFTTILHKLQASLPPSAAFLDYYWSADALYLVTVENKKNQLFSIQIDKNVLKSTILAFLSAIKTKNAAAFVASNANLSAALFHFQNNDIEKLLLQRKQWIIAPDDAIAQIPFDILQHSAPTNNISFREFPYLIQQHSLVYQYSAALYLQSKQQEYSSGHGLLAFAPFTNRNTLPVAASRNSNVTLNFAALPHSKKEMEALKQNMKATVLSSEEATKETFLAKAPNYGILHLATHTIYDSTDKEYNLVFWDKNKKAYSFLKNYEIAYSNLAAELVALSACNTANGTIETGEGAASLARAFAYTGTPNVLTTLWEVPDQANASIMQAFYINIQKGMPKDEALQQAKLHYLRTANPDNTDPKAWAGTQIIGNGDPMKCLSSAWWQSWWLIVPTLGLLLAGVFRVWATVSRKHQGE